MGIIIFVIIFCVIVIVALFINSFNKAEENYTLPNCLKRDNNKQITHTNTLIASKEEIVTEQSSEQNEDSVIQGMFMEKKRRNLKQYINRANKSLETESDSERRAVMTSRIVGWQNELDMMSEKAEKRQQKETDELSVHFAVLKEKEKNVNPDTVFQVKENFVAIDFETATPSRMACQLGIAVVENKTIINEYSFLIQPPDNYYDIYCSRVHGITFEDTVDAPTFDVIWPEIKSIIDGKHVVAHNAEFDISVLNKNLDFYNLTGDYTFKSINCTMKLYDKQRLVDLCVSYNIPLTHHDALSDTRACAMLYIEYLNGDVITSPTSYKVPRKKVRVEKELLIQDLESVENKNTIFYNKKVVFSGEFSRYPDRNKLAALLKDYGADVNSAISSKTDIFLVGENVGPSKMEKANKINEAETKIQIMKEAEFYQYIDSLL